MILVDTSVWIDHLRSAEKRLVDLLGDDSILVHPFVVEEVACGHLKDRSEVIGLLQALPGAPVATHAEVLRLISTRVLYGVGLGAVDVHLISSALLAGAAIWSKDKALSREARRLGVNIN